ncbi:MAG: hypothetical protein U0167_07500 [bacterium]
MSDYADRDDLGLFLTVIKSVSVDYSTHAMTFVVAKPFDHREPTLRFVETEVTLRSVRRMDCERNLDETELPEIYRSAVLDHHHSYALADGEKVFFFGIDWGSKYYEWYVVAKSCEVGSGSEPVLPGDGALSWMA